MSVQAVSLFRWAWSLLGWREAIEKAAATLRVPLRTHLTACLAKGALFELHALPNDPLKPCVEIPLPVQSRQKRGSAGETRRKTD